MAGRVDKLDSRFPILETSPASTLTISESLRPATRLAPSASFLLT